MKVLKFAEFVKESVIQQNSVDQLKRVRALSKGTDIGDRISDMNKEGANILSIANVIDTGIESYQDYMKNLEVAEIKKPVNDPKKVPYTTPPPLPKNGYKKIK